MNYNEYDELKAQEKALQKAKDRFFRQYAVDNENISTKLFIKDEELGLELICKKTTYKEPMYIIGEDLKILHNLLSTLFGANEIKKDVLKTKTIKS